MKLVFLGTPDFAVPSLESIIKSKHEVLAVVTQPDKPVGRKNVLTPSPIKECALRYGLKVLQYNKIRVEGVEDLKNLAPDIMVTCAFGQILSQEIIDIAPRGIINVHASLLPKYRGAAPIQYSVINGDEETGVTIMQTEAGIDTGDILSVEKTPIYPDETAGELFERLSEIGAKLIVETLDKIEAGQITPIKQDETKSTHVKMLTRETGKIDWAKSAKEIKNLVRGTNPWPAAHTILNGKTFKIFAVNALDGEFDGEIGEVLRADKKLVVKCGQGAVEILEIQAEGGKRMSAQAFNAGRKILKGDILK
ncbi:MAG TPA: methionyl-tRNA formyltransferase [Clostridiales bacterium]|nr:methionyl-tRNA formyltransferase [Clostridiales bacterium]